MVWHSINDNEFMLVVLDNSCHVFVQLIFPGRLDNAMSIFNGKNKLDMYLSIGSNLIRWD